MNLPRITRNFALAFVAGSSIAAAPLLASNSKSANVDTFEYTQTQQTQKVSPKGTVDEAVLANAPSPDVVIQGKKRKAVFVVDITNNILYKYNKDGEAEIAYSVASGKASTPTTVGARVVTHTETYPYSSAPASTKRRKHPKDYGPKIIVLEMINPKTGETWSNGEFIHGNNKPSSIGTHASGGCIRMDNEVIVELASQVKRGDVVLVTK